MKFYKIFLIIVGLTVFKDFLDIGVLAIFSKDRDGKIFNLLLFHGNLFAKLLLYVPIIVYVTRKYKLNIYSDFRQCNPKNTILLVALVILIYFVIVPLVNLETYSKLIRTGYLSYNWFDSNLLSNRNLILFLNIVLIAPVLEEIIFRGIVLKLFLRKYSAINAIVLSSLIFSVSHFKPIGFLYLFVYGLLFGYAYIKTNSLIISIFCHSMINFLSQITSSHSITTAPVFYVFIGISIGLLLIKLIISELNKDDKLLTFHLSGIKSGLKTLIKDMKSC